MYSAVTSHLRRARLYQAKEPEWNVRRAIPHLRRNFSWNRRFFLNSRAQGDYDNCTPTWASFPCTLDNDIKPPLAVYACIEPRRPISARHARFLILADFFGRRRSFVLLNAHDVGVILRRLTKMVCVYIALCIPVHSTTTYV